MKKFASMLREERAFEVEKAKKEAEKDAEKEAERKREKLEKPKKAKEVCSPICGIVSTTCDIRILSWFPLLRNKLLII